MKKILIIIFVFIELALSAQQQDLLDNTWYLESIVNENHGDPVPPPESDEFDAITLNFITDEETVSFHTGVCADIEANVTSFTANQIYFNNFVCCGENSCTDPENAGFEDEYAGFFMSEESIFYNITENDDGSLSLFLSNSIFSEAHYTNQALSTSDINSNENPFQLAFRNDNLIIGNSTAKSISIYDLSGKLVLNSDVSQNKVQTSGIPKGIYIVKVTDVNDKIFTKKIRKE